MNDEILTKLKEIEAEHQICILYAVESGSRAWGFPSKDSDYDVRFIYKRPQNWYLKLQKTKDSLDFPINDLLDFSGWDLNKTLVLLRKSNPSLLEWLKSPIVYYKDEYFFEEIKSLYQNNVNEKALLYHYLSMAETDFQHHLLGEKVKIKKYFYALRPILACQWIEAYHEEPPMLFSKLLTLPGLPPELLTEVDKLLARKLAGDEYGLEPAIPVIKDFILNQSAYFKEVAAHAEVGTAIDYETLNQFFLKWIEK